jgi:enterobacterial common antigen flippase
VTRYWRLAETSAARFSILLVTLAVTLMTARMLGPAGRGGVVQVLVWASTIGSFVNLSLGQLLQRRIQADLGDWQARALAPAVLIFAAMLVLGELVLWGAIASGQVPDWMNHAGLALALSCLFPIQAWVEFAFNFFTAIQRLRFFNFCLLASQTLVLGFVGFYLFAARGRDVSVVLALYVLGSAVLPLLTFAAVAAAVGWRGRAAVLSEMRALLAGAARLHPNTFAAYILGQGHNFMLSIMMPPAALAVFQLGAQLVTALQVVPTSASLVMYGELASRPPDAAWVKQRRFIIVLLLGYAALCGVTAAILPLLIRLLAGPDFAQSAAIGRWLLPCVWIGALPVLLAPQWITRGIFVLASALTGLAAAATVLFDYLLIPRYGISAPVIVTYAVSVICILPAQSLFVRYLERRRQSSGPEQGTYVGTGD